jgi:ABC-type glycerol-3-phosphate transport system substrate-binding protein
MGRLRTLLVSALLFSAACASPTAPQVPAGAIQVNGTVRYFTLEGAFWAVRGDDGVTYDPMNGLAPEFQRENLRVTMVANVRRDMGGIHMVGPIVDVISIRAR